MFYTKYVLQNKRNLDNSTPKQHVFSRAIADDMGTIADATGMIHDDVGPISDDIVTMYNDI